MPSIPDDLKTYRAWLLEGRSIIKGSKAEFYLVNPDRTAGRALFHRNQTQPASTPDVNDVEGWVDRVTVQEWEEIRAEQRQLSRGPRVKVRRGPHGAGVAVWCGPDKFLIALLKNHGYTYDASTRYWVHPNKDPNQVATAFEKGRVNQQRIKVTRDLDGDLGPDAPVI